MGVGKSKIDSLFVASDFNAVLQILTDMSNELNKICINQTRNGFDKKEIEDKLEEIDNYITRNPVIEKGRIEGSGDVKKIIDLLNQEVSERLKNIELNIKKDDRVGFESIEEDFKSNKTNTMQKNIEDFEKKDIQAKSMSEREEDADKIIADRTERIEKVKAFKEAQKELSKKGKYLNQGMLLKEVPKISAKLTTIEKRQNIIDKIKEPNEYRNIISKITKQVQNAKYDSKALTKKDFNEMQKSLKEIEKLKDGNPEIVNLLSDIELHITRETKNGVEVISSIDAEKLFTVFEQDKYQKIDWKDAISETKEYYNEQTKKDVEELVDYNIFELYPGKVKTWKDGLKSGVSVSTIVSEISDITKDEMKLKKQVSRIFDDLKDMDKLELEKLKAEKRKDTYKDISKRQKTTTAKLFGQDIELVNHRGENLDFAKVEEGSKEDVVKGLYDKVREDVDSDEIERQYSEALPVEYRKPNFVSRLWYRITHKETWGFGKKTLTDARKEDWVKKQIKQEIEEIKEDASGDKAWTLTPEQEKVFNERQKAVVEKAKQKGREDLIRNGQKAKIASKNAKKEYEKLQREDDEDFTL